MGLQEIMQAANELRPAISKFWNACLNHGFNLHESDDFIKAVMAHMSKYGWDTEILDFSYIITLAFKTTP